MLMAIFDYNDTQWGTKGASGRVYAAERDSQIEAGTFTENNCMAR